MGLLRRRNLPRSRLDGRGNHRRQGAELSSTSLCSLPKAGNWPGHGYGLWDWGRPDWQRGGGTVLGWFTAAPVTIKLWMPGTAERWNGSTVRQRWAATENSMQRWNTFTFYSEFTSLQANQRQLCQDKNKLICEWSAFLRSINKAVKLVLVQ